MVSLIYLYFFWSNIVQYKHVIQWDANGPIKSHESRRPWNLDYPDSIPPKPTPCLRPPSVNLFQCNVQDVCTYAASASDRVSVTPEFLSNSTVEHAVFFGTQQWEKSAPGFNVSNAIGSSWLETTKMPRCFKNVKTLPVSHNTQKKDT